MITTINNEHKKLNFSSEREQSQACLNSAEHEKNQGRKVLNVPNLRFPEFQGEWEELGLSELLDFKNGLNPKPDKFGKGIKFISVMDILNNAVITYDCIKASVDVTEKELSDFSVEKGDILFQRSSETLEDVGRANVYMDDKTAVFGGFVIRGKKKGEYSPQYFNYLLRSPFARKRIIPMGAGAQHFNIGQEGLSKVKLHFANIEEQKKIGNFLSLLDERIATQNKIIEDLKKLKCAIIETEYNSKGHEYRIGDIIEQKSLRNKSNLVKTVLSVNNKLGFINQDEQFEDRIVASEDTSNYKVVTKDDFAYNPARINVGSIARLKSYDKGIVSPMYICFKVTDSIVPEYLESYFATNQFFKEMQKRLEGSVRLCLSFEGLCNIPVVIPNMDEQAEIGKRIHLLENKIETECNILSQYEKQKQYLLRQMFI